MFDRRQSVTRLPLVGITALTLAIAGCEDDSDPIAIADQCVVATPAGTSYTGDLSTGITTGTAVRYNVTSDPVFGTLSYDQTSGGYTYTATTQSRGYRDSFTVQAVSSDGSSDTAEVDIVFGAARIMPMGDSITFGVTSSDGTNAGNLPLAADAVGYRQDLYTLLENGGYAVDFVGEDANGTAAGITDADHIGRPGEQSAYFASNVFGWLTTSPADIILMHIGTNDNFTTAGTTTGINATLTSIRSWGLQSQNPSVNTLVARLIPSLNATRDTNITSFNSDLDDLMTTSWPDLSVVDMNSALIAATDLTPSPTDTTGLHPNTTGYSKMANTWYNDLVSSGAVHNCDS